MDTHWRLTRPRHQAGSSDCIYLLEDKFEVQNDCDLPWLEIHPNSIASDFSRFEKLDVLFVGFLNFALIVEALR